MLDSAKGKAEAVQAEFGTLRVLVDAVDDKVNFFIREKSVFGAYHEFIKSIALDIQTLLAVVNRTVWDMEKEQDELVHMLARGKYNGQTN
ncbi:hypothetical protein [Flavonifractor plautii]|jgi:hypothetical protein|uniref:hypothetical protein n=1 Tax=Flavonifractor plautii TaxID=292800 RepID=UPI001896E0E0|nr:hypothetical protein [Flavonifractor plautii]MCG4657218.1 hypothetical protein [Flavonifractor plautii]MDB7874626.1 hypothetical protein [Flavonifractor plautii]